MINNTRKLKIITILVIVLFLITSCSSDEVRTSLNNRKETKSNIFDTDFDFRVATLKGPTAIGMARLVEKYSEINNNIENNFSIYNTADEIVAGLAKNEIDVAAIPANLAASLYNKTNGEIKVSAINTLGVLYIVENGNSVEKPSDLNNKTIYTIGKGTTPEAVLKSFIDNNNIENLHIEYKTDAAEIGQILMKEENSIAMLPEPFVTTIEFKNPNINTAFNMNEEWLKMYNGDLLITGVLVVRDEFLQNNREFFNRFLAEYEKSIKYTMTNVEDTAILIDELDIVPIEVGKDAIPNINIVYIEGEEMEKYLNQYLTRLYEFDENLIGGKVPDESFYYKK